MPESKISLRPAVPSDAENLYVWRQDAEARQYNREQNRDMIRRRLEQCGWDLRDERYSEYTWIVECEGEAVGVVLVKNIDWNGLCGEIGYLLSEQIRGRRIGSAAVRELVQKILSESRLQKLVAYIHPTNEKSWRILEKLGFVRKPAVADLKSDADWIYYELIQTSS